MARNAGAYGRIGASLNQKLAQLGIAGAMVGQCMENGRLPSDVVGVGLSAGVYVGASHKQFGSLKEAILSGHVQQGRTAQC